MIKNNCNFIIIIIIIVLTIVLSISIILSLTTIITIEPAHANHTKNHLNNSLIDVTITGDDIPDALLEDLKRGIIRDMKAEEKKYLKRITLIFHN